MSPGSKKKKKPIRSERADQTDSAGSKINIFFVGFACVDFYIFFALLIQFGLTLVNMRVKPNSHFGTNPR